MQINIDSILQSKRKRVLKIEKVIELAESIKLLGLINPITVRKSNSNYELIAGAHRIEAYRLLGKAEIEATIFESGDEIAELAEIDENLNRNDLTVLEQGEHLQRRNEILDAMGMRAVSGTNLKNLTTGDTVSPVQTTDDLAAEIGISERSVQRKIQIARDIDEDVKDVIRETEIADSTTQLLEIARMPVEEQKEIAEEIKNGAESVKDAKKRTNKPHVSNNSGENEWYTPGRFIEAARSVMGNIDLDPASSELANETVRATSYFTIEDNGLILEWFGNVWMNPPYSQPQITQFTELLSDKFDSGEIEQACVLVNNATETGWFQRMLESCNSICLLKSRVKFIDKQGNPTGAPLQGQIILYFGNNKDKFEIVFSELGKVFHG